MASKTTSRGKLPKFVVGPVHVRAVRGPRPDGSFYWRWTVYRDGVEHSATLGWAKQDHAVTRVAAKHAAGEMTVAKRPTLGALPVTVADLMECWVFAQNAREDIKEGSKATTRHYAEKIVGVLADVRLHELRVSHLERYQNARLATKAASNCVNHEIGILRRAWEWGCEQDYCPDRSLPRPKLKVRPKRAKLTPSYAEAEQILGQMDQCDWPFLATLLLTETGMRIGEIADLRWRDLDLANELLHVPESSKTGTREVPISAATATFLASRRDGAGRDGARPDAHVLGVGANTVRTSLSQRYLPRACKAAGLPTYLPHGFRRLAVNELYDCGAAPAVAGCLLGHAPQTAARHYLRVSNRKMLQAATSAGLLAFSKNVIRFPAPPVAEDPHTSTCTLGESTVSTYDAYTQNNV